LERVLPTDRKHLLTAVTAMLPAMTAEAARLDEAVAFPWQSFELLREVGVLPATLPESLGGLGFGYGADGAADLLHLFLLLGQGSLSVTRLYEAHANALQLICRYGREHIIARSAEDAASGELFALWVTDPPTGGIRLRPSANGFILEGDKAFCSGAGVATRALITATAEDGTRMLVVSLAPETRVKPSDIKLQGMRAAITGAIDLSGMRVSEEHLLGQPGDYLKEPVFSAGAWRGSAGALGALVALVKIHRDEIRKRRRDGDPHQQARFGQLVMACETARLWMTQAALRGCLEDDTEEAVVAYVNLARLAVEAACLDAMRLTQRGLGLGAFVAGHPAERLCRDLATYLRQPAPDETLVKAAQHYMHAELPGNL
jgi:alkylation response protein AidB-like acyl-CoA dehydrogenase